MGNNGDISLPLVPNQALYQASYVAVRQSETNAAQSYNGEERVARNREKIATAGSMQGKRQHPQGWRTTKVVDLKQRPGKHWLLAGSLAQW